MRTGQASRRPPEVWGVEGEGGEFGGDGGGDDEVLADPVAVAALAAGVGVEGGGFEGAGEEGQAGGVDGGGDAGAFDHFPEVAGEAEAGDVGGGAQAVGDGEVGGVAVEAEHGVDGGVEPGGFAASAAGGGEDEARAEGLGEVEAVAGAEGGLAEEAGGVRKAEDAKAVLGFVVPDGVAAGNDAAGLGDLVGAAADDVGGDGRGEVLGEGGDVEGEGDFAAHGVHVGHGVGGGDGAVLPGVVDEGGEEVEGGDDGGTGVDAPDGGVVGRAQPGEEVGVSFGIKRGGEGRQNLRQGLGPGLGRSAAAAGQIGEANLVCGHGGIVPDGSAGGSGACQNGGVTLDPDAIMDALGELYGEPCARPHGDALAELVLTVLSQNTSDRNSGRAFVQLMRRYRDWDAIAGAPLEELIATIQTGGLARQKAPRIQRILAAVRERAPDWNLAFLEEEPIEEARGWLRGLPGVGPKTAACVLLFALGRPALPVDTHVERVAKRLALVPPGTTAEGAHERLEALAPPEQYYRFHMLLIKHGRRTCGARAPRCEACPLERACPGSVLRDGAAS